MPQRKRQRTSRKIADTDAHHHISDLFDVLPDDIVVSVLCKLSSSASRPSDFFNILPTCKRLNRLATHPLVLSNAGPKSFVIESKNWSDSAHRFLKQCINTGNVEACYTLGMIRFYCLQNRGSGVSLIAKAAIKSHAPALYSLGVMQFNGSGRSKIDKDLRAGVALCARAAVLGHIDALRELGHSLQDGYGVPQNITEGRRLLFQANAREVASALRSMLTCQTQGQNRQHQPLQNGGSCIMGTMRCPLLSDFCCNVPPPEVHPVNQFMRGWFESRRGILEPNLRLCSHSGCGRPETRPHEFRRCSVCGKVNYCSRGCQALDWKLRHKNECLPMEQWHEPDAGNDNVAMFQ